MASGLGCLATLAINYVVCMVGNQQGGQVSYRWPFERGAHIFCISKNLSVAFEIYREG
jgi:hypothetical protein